jgi:hypothetical protein
MNVNRLLQLFIAKRRTSDIESLKRINGLKGEYVLTMVKLLARKREKCDAVVCALISVLEEKMGMSRDDVLKSVYPKSRFWLFCL